MTQVDANGSPDTEDVSQKHSIKKVTNNITQTPKKIANVVEDIVKDVTKIPEKTVEVLEDTTDKVIGNVEKKNEGFFSFLQNYIF